MMTQSDPDIVWLTARQCTDLTGFTPQKLSDWVRKNWIIFDDERGPVRVIDRYSLLERIKNPPRRGRKKTTECKVVEESIPPVEPKKFPPPPLRRKRMAEPKPAEQFPSPPLRRKPKPKPAVEPPEGLDKKDASPRKKIGTYRERYVAEIKRRIRGQDWAGMTPKKLVALYWYCHEHVYGVVPIEIQDTENWAYAAKAAVRMVDKRFDGDTQQAIKFMRWVWAREGDREIYRRDNQIDGGRISWMNQFSHTYLLSDWRIAASRANGIK